MIDTTLVTVHGFWSSPATWNRLNAVWQADEELRGLRIHNFPYDSPKKPPFPFSTSRIPDLDDLGEMLATEYGTKLSRASSIAFVTHSQGGLVLQRFLAWMVNYRRARELDRIRTIVMLACPNGGSQYLHSIRRVLGYGRHPQAGSLQVLDRHAKEAQRIVLERIVHASGIDDHEFPIPFHVYAGGSDKIVPPASAKDVFHGAGTIAGNHFTILNPDVRGSQTAEVVKHHILSDATPHRAPDGRKTPSAGRDAGRPATETRPDIRYEVSGGQGIQIGNNNVQHNIGWTAASED